MIYNNLKKLIVLGFTTFTIVLSPVTTDALNLHGKYTDDVIPVSFKTKLNQLDSKIQNSPYYIIINHAKQTLTVISNTAKDIIATYDISTAKRGLGETSASKKTPRGVHRIHQKIGHNAPVNAIFKNRQFSGRIWQPMPRNKHRYDYIVTRILVLDGLEPGFNKGFNSHGKSVDSNNRGIYIHGTTMEWKLGSPASIGCIHMSNTDLIELFNMVPVGTLVWIE
jgi:hypothetical protein